MGVKVRIARTFEDVEGLRGQWTAWQGHHDSDIDFFLELLRSREEILNPYVLVVEREGVPDAILIGRVEKTHIQVRIGYLRLGRLGAKAIKFQYGALRGNASDENCREMIARIRSSLRSGEADMTYFDHPDTESALYRHAKELHGKAGGMSHASPRYKMQLPQKGEGLSGFSRGIRRKEKKLLAAFGDTLKVHRYRDFSQLDEALSMIEEVAKKTYHRGLGVGFENVPRIRKLIELSARKGWLRIYLLSVDEKPIAFWLGDVYGDSFFSMYTGYDPIYTEYGPGAYLHSKGIEDLCSEGVMEIDFGLGDAEWKKRFSNLQHTESPVTAFAPTFRGKSLGATEAICAAADSTAKRVLENTKLLPKVKKLWRKRLSTEEKPKEETTAVKA